MAPRGPLGVLCRFGGATTTKVFFCYYWWCNCFSWYYCCYTHLSQVLRLPRKKDNEMSKRQKYCACHTKRKSNTIQNTQKVNFTKELGNTPKDTRKGHTTSAFPTACGTFGAAHDQPTTARHKRSEHRSKSQTPPL